VRRALLVVLLLLPASLGRAIVLQEDELAEKSTTLGVQLRTFAFVLAGDVLAPPYQPEDANPLAIGLIDLRLSFTHRRSWLKVAVHDQLTQQVRGHTLTTPLAFGRGGSRCNGPSPTRAATPCATPSTGCTPP
jgi:hypothetical protein